MKKLLISTFSALTLLATSCSEAPKHKSLILYYSETGTTKVVAEELQNQLGADLDSITLVKPYSGIYQETIERGRNELENGILPELKPLTKVIEDYDTIYLGYPIWFGTYAMPIHTLVKEHDFEGKVVIPFCTFGSGGLNTSSDALSKALPKANIQPGYGVRSARLSSVSKELNRYLIEYNYKPGIIEALPGYSEQQPVTKEQIAIFDSACSGYKYPLGTPITVGVRTTSEGVDYEFTVNSRGMDGIDKQSIVYVTISNTDGSQPEFTQVVR